jgi:hypothetical protein
MEETTREEEQEEAIGNCCSIIPLEIGLSKKYLFAGYHFTCGVSYSYLYETCTVVEGKA